MFIDVTDLKKSCTSGVVTSAVLKGLGMRMENGEIGVAGPPDRSIRIALLIPPARDVDVVYGQNGEIRRPERESAASPEKQIPYR